MKIALIGYGKMGKEIEQIAKMRNHQIVQRITDENTEAISLLIPANCDVAIEFTQPESAVQNILTCFKNNIPVVCGTTGWYHDLDKIKAECNSSNNTFLYASNFSVGVNIFFELNRKLSEMMNKLNEYKLSVTEIHHIHKKDKPSGTALTLVNDLIQLNKKYVGWKLKEDKNEQQNIIPIDCLREDEVVGTHLINYKSSIDDIEIKHTAHSRQGFASGAVLAAEFIQHKKGFYEMNDLMKQLLS